jgi:hypothetical protein
MRSQQQAGRMNTHPRLARDGHIPYSRHGRWTTRRENTRGRENLTQNCSREKGQDPTHRECLAKAKNFQDVKWDNTQKGGCCMEAYCKRGIQIHGIKDTIQVGGCRCVGCCRIQASVATCQEVEASEWDKRRTTTRHHGKSWDTARWTRLKKRIRQLIGIENTPEARDMRTRRWGSGGGMLRAIRGRPGGKSLQAKG